MTRQEAETEAAKIQTTIGGWYEDKLTKVQLNVTKIVVTQVSDTEWRPVLYGYIPATHTYYVCDADRFPQAVLAIKKPV